MAKSQSIKRFRVESILKSFGKSVFLTLTTKDRVDYQEIRKRWRKFRHDFFQSIGTDSKWVMCFEPHPLGHGWHIHCVINKPFISLKIIRKFSSRSNFGRVHIERVLTDDMSKYVSKYVTKSESKTKSDDKHSRLRLVNVSRGLTILDDIKVRSDGLNFAKNALSKYTPSFLLDIPEYLRHKFAYHYFYFGSNLYGFDIPQWESIRLKYLEIIQN